MHSRRRRTALTVSAAAAAVVAAPLLSACGMEAHPGAAAVVDGERISMGQLQARAGAVREAQQAGASQDQRMVKSGGMLTRAALDEMIRDRVVERVADEAGVSVSRREVGQARGRLAKQAGGERALKEQLLQQYGIAPGDIDRRLRSQLAIGKIAEKKGFDTRSPEGNAQLNALFAKTSKAMHIDVNPRYGKWDTERAGLGEARDGWLRDHTAGQAGRQITPAP